LITLIDNTGNQLTIAIGIFCFCCLVVDLVTALRVGNVSHDTKIGWLEVRAIIFFIIN